MAPTFAVGLALVGPMKWLIFGDRQLALRGQSVLVGRDRFCEVRLAEGIASRKHATITAKGDEYEVVDHRSRNGTFLNGRPVTGSTTLQHKDVIRIGGTELLFAEWTPTPGSKTNPDPVKDFSFSESSVSGNPTQTGANLICTVLYRSLRAGDVQNAKRIAEGLCSRIGQSAASGALEASELNAVAPALIEFCRITRDAERITWLIRIYATRRLFPKLSTASSLRSLGYELSIDKTCIKEWLERTRRYARTEAHESCIDEMKMLLRDLG